LELIQCYLLVEQIARRFCAPVQIYRDQCRQYESNWF